MEGIDFTQCIRVILAPCLCPFLLETVTARASMAHVWATVVLICVSLMTTPCHPPVDETVHWKEDAKAHIGVCTLANSLPLLVVPWTMLV